MITDMERIGDQTADIAEIIISSGENAAEEIHVIGTMASEVEPHGTPQCQCLCKQRP